MCGHHLQPIDDSVLLTPNSAIFDSPLLPKYRQIQNSVVLVEVGDDSTDEFRPPFMNEAKPSRRKRNDNNSFRQKQEKPVMTSRRNSSQENSAGRAARVGLTLIFTAIV